jgi:heme/copper-type cytochrome/quinol oxidase subunit 2
MRGFLTVETPDAFQKWMDDEEAKLKTEGEDSGWN